MQTDTRLSRVLRNQRNVPPRLPPFQRLRVSHFLAALVPSLALPLSAQTVTTRDTDLLNEPNGRPVATLIAGTEVTPGRTRGEFTEVTVGGFVASSLTGGPRERFPLSVRGTGVRLRAAPSASSAIRAEMRDGMGLNRVARQGSWTRVHRTAWVRSSALRAPTIARRAEPVAERRTVGTAAAILDTSPNDSPAPAPTAGTVAPMMAGSDIILRAAPDGAPLATIRSSTPVTQIARDRGWVRVRIEGWVPEADIMPSDTGAQLMLSAADLRADPAAVQGKLVRWDVQILALQTADPLRRDLRENEPYFLARGPGSENAVLYLAIPPALLEVARQLPPLSEVTISARVRTGRSEPVGVPILELIQIVRR